MENHNMYEEFALGGGGEGEANLVLDYFLLNDCCLADLREPVCPYMNGVGDGGTILRALVLGITKGPSVFTQESEGAEGGVTARTFFALIFEDEAPFRAALVLFLPWLRPVLEVISTTSKSDPELPLPSALCSPSEPS
ncbi:hypothetical protein M9H77_14338 [Catharanthus roseus]|uniref:Uncharacterized protein n=1 Tax=Catharanthus roseus TaxID=4058 RepID=A0ACC0BN11_CATRO|nr:hypothetical protein M9H77_14338 [Catharanthus roseus]